jgi:hypothetical protein
LTVDQNDFNNVWKLFFEYIIQEFLLLLKDKLVLSGEVIELFSEHVLGFFKPDIIIVFKILDEFIEPIERFVKTFAHHWSPRILKEFVQLHYHFFV